jgi:nucleotide-binding universal stress UspA family protein
MYSHILIATDGSPLSLKAARAGAELAKKAGAKLTAVYVIPSFAPGYAGEGLYFSNVYNEKEYMLGMKAVAQKALAKVEAAAGKAGVSFASSVMVSPTPWEGILKAASKLKCDTIVMSSHGRSGLAGVVLGSQTTRVLAHSKLPVLVCR